MASPALVSKCEGTARTALVVADRADPEARSERASEGTACGRIRCRHPHRRYARAGHRPPAPFARTDPGVEPVRPIELDAWAVDAVRARRPPRRAARTRVRAASRREHRTRRTAPAATAPGRASPRGAPRTARAPVARRARPRRRPALGARRSAPATTGSCRTRCSPCIDTRREGRRRTGRCARSDGSMPVRARRPTTQSHAHFIVWKLYSKLCIGTHVKFSMQSDIATWLVWVSRKTSDCMSTSLRCSSL